MTNNRVALLVPSLRGGGAERVMVNLARGLVERGLEVDFVLAQAEGPYLSQLPGSVRLIDLKAERVLYSLPRLVSYLRRQRPHALLSAMDHTNVVALLAQKAARVRTRVVVTVHITLSRATETAESLRGRLMPVWIRLFYPWAHAIVAVSQGVAEDLVRATGLSRQQVHVVYNPVVTPQLLSEADKPLDHPWFKPGEPPIILSVGRLTEQKDFCTLIRAFCLVRKQRPARLVILGEGEDRPKLEDLVRNLGIHSEVAMPGFAQNPYQFMKRAAVFVLSSRWEGLPTVLIEAMAVGTPVVSTDCPSGPREILEGGRWGKLVAPGNADELATAVLAALDDARPTPRSVERFTLEHAVTQYLALMEG